jgi:hypothetical protein
MIRMTNVERLNLEMGSVGDQRVVWMTWRQGQEEVGSAVVGCKQQHEECIKELQI